MGWTSIDVPANELALAALGKPLVCSPYSLNAGFGGQPIWSNATGLYTDPDRTDPVYPTRLSYDGSMARRTQPGAAFAGTSFGFVFQLTPGTFDTIAILSHNLGNIGAAYTIAVIIADAADFSLGFKQILFLLNRTSTSRIVSINLKHDALPNPQRYTSAGNWWMRIAISSAATYVPMIGEVYVGQRLQLGERMDEPNKQEQYRDEAVDFWSKSKAGFTRYRRAKGQRIYEGTHTIIDPADFSRARQMYTDGVLFNSAPVLFIEDPSQANETEPAQLGAGLWMVPPAGFVAPYTNGPQERQLDLSFEEIAPFALSNN